MQPKHRIGRRSFLVRVTGGALLAGGLGTVSGLRAGQVPQGPPRSPYEEPRERAAGTGYTDRDPSDPVGRGRGTTPQGAPRSPYATPQDRAAGTGYTDRDPTDPVGYGRQPSPHGAPASPYEEPRERAAGTGITDSDPSDPVGRGTGRRRCSDADAGPGADPGGRGRRC